MTDPDNPGPIVGVLLAAGRGQRFDASGAQSKLLQATPRGARAGVPVAVAAARALRAGVDQMVAVVPPAHSDTQRHLHALLAAEACTLVVNPRAAEGIGTSIAAGVAATAAASGWIIALADMPFVEPATVQAVAAALRSGATTALPAHRGKRGHPVGFAAACRNALLALEGNVGARVVLARFPPRVLAVEDAGCLVDLDLPGDFSTD
jgi:molybdenum cofactor cytidylyltransferase